MDLRLLYARQIVPSLSNYEAPETEGNELEKLKLYRPTRINERRTRVDFNRIVPI